MFFYDWPKIYDASQGSVIEIVRIFRMIVEKQIPKNKYDPIYRYSQKNFSGISFMLHPDVLLYHSFKYKYREIAQYISLCALRSSADFISTQDPSLDVILLPGLDPEKIIENNRLLIIDEDKVYFRYEEVNPKEIH
jgi:hypothetical protein|tara:strand:- start:251 stop:658 length:408 start_codon:yes stop_codon:yes gene_type:complete